MRRALSEKKRGKSFVASGDGNYRDGNGRSITRCMSVGNARRKCRTDQKELLARASRSFCLVSQMPVGVLRRLPSIKAVKDFFRKQHMSVASFLGSKISARRPLLDGKLLDIMKNKRIACQVDKISPHLRLAFAVN